MLVLYLCFSSPAAACEGPCDVCGCPDGELCNPYGYCEIGTDLGAMIRIPAGEFLMGEDEPPELPDAIDYYPMCFGPRHEVYLGSFLIDRFPVTNGEYALFLNEAGPVGADGEVYIVGFGQSWCHPFITYPEAIADWSVYVISIDGGGATVLEGAGRHPVIQATWQGAHHFCELKGRRLCTEAEWERAAAGTEGLTWPWGNTWPADVGEHANCSDYWMASLPDLPICSDGYNQTSPVDAFPKGRALGSGCQDMAGNFDEWVNDLWDCHYYETSVTWMNPKGPCEGEFPCAGISVESRVVKGGREIDNGFLLANAARSSVGSIGGAGFRCCADD